MSDKKDVHEEEQLQLCPSPPLQDLCTGGYDTGKMNSEVSINLHNVVYLTEFFPKKKNNNNN